MLARRVGACRFGSKADLGGHSSFVPLTSPEDIAAF
jgi:hypothetical protein